MIFKKVIAYMATMYAAIDVMTDVISLAARKNLETCIASKSRNLG